jgi:heme-degrading monooxygenase HmoA
MTDAGGTGPGFAEGQVVTVFRSRRRPESEAEYRQVSRLMEEAARATPGFVDFKTFTADDGEHVSLVTFADPAAHRAWRDDSRHLQAQRQGRDEFYREYSVQVGACSHVSTWVFTPD